MRTSTRLLSIVLSSLALAAVAAFVVLVPHGVGAQAQTPPAPCACSRSTPIAGADEVSAVPGQLQPRFGITHCTCGAATCVSQVAYGSLGVPQLFCVIK